MENCDKLKKRALIGLILFFYVVSTRFIDLSIYIGLPFTILSIVIVGILSLYLSLPYISCLNNNNTSHKPPFNK